jgi:protein-S-isoprenylcysteine O-methyltransferase Ste14
MDTTLNDPKPADATAKGSSKTALLWIRQFFFLGVLGAVLLGAAGRWDLPWFWAFLTTHAALLAIQTRTMDAGLTQERRQPGPGGSDRALRTVAMPLYVLFLVVSGLDVGRFGWSARMPAPVQAFGLIGYGAGMSLTVWAMSVNRFFSPVIRIQSEREHHVITGGPYRYVRHPSYCGGLIAELCGGIALGSWWGVLPMLPVVVLTLRRTALEDRLLRWELAGYDKFCREVRFRLVPGVW